MIAFDVVQRWLKASGYARHLTCATSPTSTTRSSAARVENGETMRALTDRMIAAMHHDFDALGIERPTHEPRATDYVPQMLDSIAHARGQGPGLPRARTAT